MPHVIQQESFHVALNGSEQDGLALQRRLSDLHHDVILPAIERALDRCAPSAGHLYVERLNVDVGCVSLVRLEQDLADLVTEALDRSLKECLLQNSREFRTGIGDIRYKTVSQSVYEAFLSFLTTGTLPWWFRLPAGMNLERAVLDLWQEREGPDAALRSSVEALRRLLASPVVRERLVRQCSRLFLDFLLEKLSPLVAAITRTVLGTLRISAIPQEGLKEFERRLWERSLAIIPTGLVPSPDALAAEAWATFSRRGDPPAGPGHVLEQHWPGATSKVLNGETTDRQQPSSPSPSPRPLGLDRIEPLNVAEGLYIENAGLVILHPFLPQLFSALSIATDDAIVLPDRGLSLLHYLATGQTIAPEYELVLGKVLCNVPLETPVESNVELSQTECEEATALLEAVVRHWDALRNTSSDGLREAFLLRPGKLSLSESGEWLLRVEPQSIDILLDQLPWGISRIKLPWMDTMLNVEWR